MRIKTQQYDNKDCGPICVSMIAAKYNIKIPLQVIREKCKTGINGTTLLGLVEGGKELGFLVEAKSGIAEELIKEIGEKQICLPAIAHLKSNHYVVIEAYKKNKFVIFDPQKGKTRINVEDFSYLWSGYVIVYEKTNKCLDSYTSPRRLANYFAITLKHWKILSATLLLSIFISFIGLLGAYLFQTIIDDYVHTVEHEDCDDEHDNNENILLSVVYLFTKDTSMRSVFITMIVFLLLYGYHYISAKLFDCRLIKNNRLRAGS